ncbi:AmmeMemoRadiSam system protein A [bacterium]|nr:AmmeMemoRadiSam system protein A [bacterium]
MELTDQEKKTLLEIAKRAIVAKAGNRELPKLTIDLPILKEKRGAFVTLKKRGHLRGCIGYIKAVKPLGDTVQEMAVAAAFHDPRFPSVKSDEIRDLSFEISVLSPLQKIQNIEDIEVGKHGLFIVRGYNSGLLLPQVATEYGWDRETFLKETCYKAGLPPRIWKDKETEIYIFSADYFSDKD